MKRYFIILTLLLCTVEAFAYKALGRNRNRFEIYGGLPITSTFSDIGGSIDRNNLGGIKDLSPRSFRPGLTFGGNYIINQFFSVNAQIIGGWWSGTDVNSVNKYRDLAFNTFGSEITTNFLVYLFREKNAKAAYGANWLKWPLDVYGFIGVGANIFYVQPLKELKNRTSPITDITAVLPLGFGIRLNVSQTFKLGFELGGRFLTTDKFDGYATKFSKSKDVYYVVNICAHYRILTNNTYRRR